MPSGMSGFADLFRGIYMYMQSCKKKKKKKKAATLRKVLPVQAPNGVWLFEFLCFVYGLGANLY